MSRQEHPVPPLEVLAAFKAELEALQNKYKMALRACDCCGNISVVPCPDGVKANHNKYVERPDEGWSWMPKGGW